MLRILRNCGDPNKGICLRGTGLIGFDPEKEAVAAATAGESSGTEHFKLEWDRTKPKAARRRES